MKSDFMMIYRNLRANAFLQNYRHEFDQFKVLLFNKHGKGRIACESLDHQEEHY